MLSFEHLNKAMEPDYGEDNRHRAFNYQICSAIDLLNVSIILERMEILGLSEQESRAIKTLASAANCLFRQANDRLFSKSLSSCHGQII